MNRSKFDPHSFIIKIWLDENPESAGRAVLRGHVTHVPSGERSYVKDLDEISAFMAPYLQGLGVRLSWLSRTQLWLWRRSKRRRPAPMEKEE